MSVIYQCKKCGAIIEKGTIVCWYCKTYLDKDDIAIGRTKIRRSNLTAKPDVNEIELSEIKFNKVGKTGFVYLLKGGNHFKIGKTITLNKRIKKLKIQLPYKCELVHSIKTNNIDALESFWHQRFSSKRRNGEWFQLNKNEINEFINYRLQIFE